MPCLLFLLAVIAAAELLMFSMLRLKYGNDCSGNYQPRAMTVLVPELECTMSGIDLERLLRAWSIACASLCWKGEGEDSDGIQSLGDEFYRYITGDDNAAIPRPDKLARGKMPKP